VLPQVGLALMKINEKELLEMDDVVSTVSLIKNTKIDVEQLIHVRRRCDEEEILFLINSL
jgi:hypothetical protein